MRDQTTREPSALRVTIVGGGAAAVVAAVRLLAEATPARPVAVTIVEKDQGIGPGLAYRTAHPRHTLNNFAERLSVVDGDADHLLRWCARRGAPAEPQSFLSRRRYGEYLAETLAETPVPAGSSLSLTRGHVVDVLSTPHPRVVTADGRTLETDVVVLALGNPPPRPRPDLEQLGDRFVADPWTGALAVPRPGRASVLLIGTGLTMVDVVAQLHDDHPDLVFTAVSRSLLVPRSHRRRTRHPHDAFDPGVSSLDDLVDAVRRRIAEVEEIGGDWRDVIDAVRAYGNRSGRASSPTTRTGSSPRWPAAGTCRGTGCRPRWRRTSTACWPPGCSSSRRRAPSTPRRTTWSSTARDPLPSRRRGGTCSSTGCWRGACSPRTGWASGSTSTGTGARAAPTASRTRTSTCSARPGRGSSGRSPRSRTCARRPSPWPTHLGARHQTPNTWPPSTTMKAETTTMKNTRTNREPRATAVRAPR